MARREQYQPDDIKNGQCPECGSKSLLFTGGYVQCRNCDTKIGNRASKYNAKRTEFNGKLYDSKHEANTAASLELRKRAKDIKDYDTQYRIDMWCHRPDGEPAFMVRHKVDFRVHENDGSFTLLEAKGMVLDDYKWRRKFLENIWLPMNPDYTYQVIMNRRNR